MAIPNPFRRRDSNTRSRWGYTFQWTPQHLSPEQSHPLKYSYDTLGEECLNILNDISPSDTISHGRDEKAQDGLLDQPTQEKPIKAKRDLYLLLRDNRTEHPKLEKLWDEVTNVPEWVDWDQIARGQDVFYRYGGATITGLAYQSLLGGMGASRVVEVLVRTGGFSVKVARSRLFETTQHILECTRSIDAIKPEGAGFASSLRVRLLHAAVRHRIMKLAETRPEYYNVEKYGVPINDLDCIGTILSFSATVTYLSLPRQGIFMRRQEVEDYNALWRLIAHYTGTPTEWFETPERAKAIMQSLMLYEIEPSETSRVLAANLIRCLEAQPPAYASRSFLEVNARWLNGNELCDALGLGRPSAWYWSLMAGQCIFFMGICYLYRSIPRLDRRKIKALRHILWAVIVEGKSGLGKETVFDFKYIPDYNVTTARASDEQTGIKERGVERRNFQTLLIAGGVFAGAGYIGLRIASILFNRIL